MEYDYWEFWWAVFDTEERDETLDLPCVEAVWRSAHALGQSLWCLNGDILLSLLPVV